MSALPKQESFRDRVSGRCRDTTSKGVGFGTRLETLSAVSAACREGKLKFQPALQHFQLDVLIFIEFRMPTHELSLWDAILLWMWRILSLWQVWGILDLTWVERKIQRSSRIIIARVAAGVGASEYIVAYGRGLFFVPIAFHEWVVRTYCDRAGTERSQW